MHSPLFKPGFHDITVEDLSKYFVEPFNDGKEHRQELTALFCRFLNKIEELNMPFEAWIDGSYSTSKPCPGDVDVVILIPAAALNEATPEQQAKVSYLFGGRFHEEIKTRYGCDSYFINGGDVNWRAYWKGFFGFDREDRPKGIPRIVKELSHE